MDENDYREATFPHPYEPWWRLGAPFTMWENALLWHLAEAHSKVALRGNLSGHVFQQAFASSGSYTNALIAALSTLGTRHGPITQTQWLLETVAHEGTTRSMMDYSVRGKVPGWGNSIIKGRPDPAFILVEHHLREHERGSHQHPAAISAIDAITRSLRSAGKMVYPNPSCWTAAVAITVGLPATHAPYLFVAGRLGAWGASTLGFKETP